MHIFTNGVVRCRVCREGRRHIERNHEPDRDKRTLDTIAPNTLGRDPVLEGHERSSRQEQQDKGRSQNPEGRYE